MISLFTYSSWVASLPCENVEFILLGGIYEEKDMWEIGHKEQQVEREASMSKSPSTKRDLTSKYFETNLS